MNYELFEFFNDGDYINESSTDVETFLNLMEIPIPTVIPEDGSYSEPSVIVEDNSDGHADLHSFIIKEIIYTYKVKLCPGCSSDEPRALIDVVNETKFNDGDSRIKNSTLVLIGNRWYRCV